MSKLKKYWRKYYKDDFILVIKNKVIIIGKNETDRSTGLQKMIRTIEERKATYTIYTNSNIDIIKRLINVLFKTNLTI